MVVSLCYEDHSTVPWCVKWISLFPLLFFFFPVSTSVSLGGGLLFSSLRRPGARACEGLSLCVDAIVALSLPIQPLFSIPVCQTLPAFTGLPWRWTCSYWHWLSNATPVSTATPQECCALVWNDRSARGRARTHPKLGSDSGPAQCRCRSVVYVAAVRSCRIAECWNPLSSAACRPWTHNVHLHAFELGYCRWTAAVTALVAAPPPFYDLFYGNKQRCRCGLVRYVSDMASAQRRCIA